MPSLNLGIVASLYRDFKFSQDRAAAGAGTCWKRPGFSAHVTKPLGPLTTPRTSYYLDSKVLSSEPTIQFYNLFCSLVSCYTIANRLLPSFAFM